MADFDLAVIGAGATGTAIARDAAGPMYPYPDQMLCKYPGRTP
jgi:hypothetical protein